MASKKFDFSGWATRNNLRCSDGRTIRKDAFKDDDGSVVPLVWQHSHDNPMNVLGHALLENRSDGVYTYGTFNNTEQAKVAKELLRNGDITSLSIFANQLKQNGGDVLHGSIKEVSLVLTGANPGAFIDNVVLEHSDGGDDYISDTEAVIYTGQEIDIPGETVKHSVGNTEVLKEDGQEPSSEEKEKPMTENKEKTVGDVFNTLTDEQKKVVYFLIGSAIQEKKNKSVNSEDDEENEEMQQSGLYGGEDMKYNVFDNSMDNTSNNTLSHSEMVNIFDDARRYGSLKDSVLAHGITNIEYLFPDMKNVSNVPEFVTRNQGWVDKVLNSTHHTPFSRIKSLFADLTESDARAKGYIKGNLKTDEVFSLLKRTTSPTTIYKKQKVDRDDVVDITDFDVVSWIKTEMRMMLNEEIARAILVGDGRLSSSDDKINEGNVRPIWTDSDFYSIKAQYVPSAQTDEAIAKGFIRNAVKSRKNYKGSGNPTLYCTEDILANCLLLEDTTGRIIYDTTEKLVQALRVKEIVTVSSMEDLTRTLSVSGTNYTATLHGILVNLDDYNIGADKGGAINMFDDFDIDYNAQKYLIETRCSGALIKPYSAIVVESLETVVAG